MKRESVTEVQQLALDMLFRALKVNVHNRTTEEYVEISRLIPASLKVVTWMVNDELACYSRTDEFKRREFCRFKAGHKVAVYEHYPTTISRETVRRALFNSYWQELRENGPPNWLILCGCPKLLESEN